METNYIQCPSMSFLEADKLIWKLFILLFLILEDEYHECVAVIDEQKTIYPENEKHVLN